MKRTNLGVHRAEIDIVDHPVFIGKKKSYLLLKLVSKVQLGLNEHTMCLSTAAIILSRSCRK